MQAADQNDLLPGRKRSMTGVNPPGLPGTSFRPSEGGVVPEMDSRSGTQMSIRSWNCPSNYIHPKGLTVDDGSCHPKV